MAAVHEFKELMTLLLFNSCVSFKYIVILTQDTYIVVLKTSYWYILYKRKKMSDLSLNEYQKLILSNSFNKSKAHFTVF